MGAFGVLADVASAHHERLDGRGYHRRIEGTRAALGIQGAGRGRHLRGHDRQAPYRDAMPWSRIQEIMSRDTGSGVDADCFAALERWQERNQLASRVEAQMREVDRLVAEL